MFTGRLKISDGLFYISTSFFDISDKKQHTMQICIIQAV
ncbi:hypothetical protein l13_20420 [Neisseria weaveri ATCC 51223]|nr:hypothetical protein l13_20420 [Neisseria weaveri ATCC 51223]